MARRTSGRVLPLNAQEAVESLWADYAAALEIRKKFPLTTKSDGTVMARINDEADKLGVNPDILRKLRQMVDPENGYTMAEFKALCKLCLDHDYVIGRSYVFKFFTVPKGPKRLAFQTKAIEKGWTLARIARNCAGSSAIGNRAAEGLDCRPRCRMLYRHSMGCAFGGSGGTTSS